MATSKNKKTNPKEGTTGLRSTTIGSKKFFLIGSGGSPAELLKASVPCSVRDKFEYDPLLLLFIAHLVYKNGLIVKDEDIKKELQRVDILNRTGVNKDTPIPLSVHLANAPTENLNELANILKTKLEVNERGGIHKIMDAFKTITEDKTPTCFTHDVAMYSGYSEYGEAIGFNVPESGSCLQFKKGVKNLASGNIFLLRYYGGEYVYKLIIDGDSKCITTLKYLGLDNLVSHLQKIVSCVSNLKEFSITPMLKKVFVPRNLETVSSPTSEHYIVLVPLTKSKQNLMLDLSSLGSSYGGYASSYLHRRYSASLSKKQNEGVLYNQYDGLMHINGFLPSIAKRYNYEGYRIANTTWTGNNIQAILFALESTDISKEHRSVILKNNLIEPLNAEVGNLRKQGFKDSLDRFYSKVIKQLVFQLHKTRSDFTFEYLMRMLEKNGIENLILTQVNMENFIYG